MTVSGDIGQSATGATFEPLGADTPVVVTRSEERLGIQKQAVAVERVRLQKYIVTEERTITVSVRREEVRLVREPLDGGLVDVAESARSDDDITVVLSEEQVVVSKRIVPVERVRLLRHAVTENRVITEEIRKERVDVDTTAGTIGAGEIGAGEIR